MKRQGPPKFQNPAKPFERIKLAGKPKTETRTEEIKTNWRNKETPKSQNEIFDKIREITCTISIYVPN